MVALVEAAAPAGATTAVRPVSRGNCRRKARALMLAKQRAAVIREALGHIQVKVGVYARLSKLHLVVADEHEKMYPSMILWKINMRNAYSEIICLAVLLALFPF